VSEEFTAGAEAQIHLERNGANEFVFFPSEREPEFQQPLKPRPSIRIQTEQLLRGLSFTPYPAYIRKLGTVV
jgi:hypothetical protein